MIYTLTYNFNNNINQSLLYGTIFYLILFQNKTINYYSALFIPLDYYLLFKSIKNKLILKNLIKLILNNFENLKKQKLNINYTLKQTVKNIIN